MAEEEESRSIEEALNEIVTTTDKSGNMKKELKKTIYENVSRLRNYYIRLKDNLEEGKRQKEQMDNENNTLKTELDAYKKATNKSNTENNRGPSRDRGKEPSIINSGQVLPSHENRIEKSTNTQNKRETPTKNEKITPNTASRQQLPTHDSTPRLYSDVTAERNKRKYKITVSTKGTHTSVEVQNLLKERVKLTDIKVGVQSIKTLSDGSVIIQVGSEKERELLEEGIRQRCGEELETTVQQPRKPRLVFLNIPNEITMENVAETLTTQNTEINLQERCIAPKFSYATKRGIRNLVAEVDSETRKKVQQTRVKLGWTICRRLRISQEMLPMQYI
jgi:hypothetical protein